MQKVSSSSAYDAIIIRHKNQNNYKSTPFQVVFSSNLINNKKKSSQDIVLQINDQKKDILMKIDHNSGRVMFEKKFIKKTIVSDSSDFSQDDNRSFSDRPRSISREKKLASSNSKNQKLQDFKNQQAPTKNFWQFAWLFQNKKRQDEAILKNRKSSVFEEQSQSKLSKINEEEYQGLENSWQPMFHLSLCGNQLKNKETKEEIIKTFFKYRVDYKKFIKDPNQILSDSNLVVKIDDSIYTWQLGLAILTCRFAYGQDLSNELVDDIIKNKFTKSRWLHYLSSGPGITKLDINQKGAQVQTIDFRKVEVEQSAQNYIIKYRKTPPNQTIEKMGLKYGLNKAKFILTLKDGSVEQVCMKIFLWDDDQKVIISDIDGTITKSDILGQILPQYIHEGVIQLFSQIYKRGYKIIYLTARAIGQYQQTIKFLQGISQDGIALPSGPLLMSPDGYVKSFARQVIYKTPDYLKTKILASLNEIFPNQSNPIYCGFGNRETDSVAYLKINILPQRIFCISQKSIINRESDKEYCTTYVKMLKQNLDELFPIFEKPATIEDTKILSNDQQWQIQRKNSEDNYQSEEQQNFHFNSTQANHEQSSVKTEQKNVLRSQQKQKQTQNDSIDQQIPLIPISRVKTQEDKQEQISKPIQKAKSTDAHCEQNMHNLADISQNFKFVSEKDDDKVKKND